MKTGITHFSDKSVLWFIGVVEAAYLLGALAKSLSGNAPQLDGAGLFTLLFGGVIVAGLCLLLWGATMPLFAWVKYYRTVRGFGLARSLLIVVGALLSVGLVLYAFIWAAQDMVWVSLVIAIGSLINLFFAPWAIARERRYNASLNEINVNAKRLD